MSMQERLPIEKSEMENPEAIFSAIAAVRGEAQAQREAYLESVREMQELCGQIRGVELLITGRLHGRGGTVVYRDDPLSVVEQLHVRVGSAQVNTYEGQGGLITKHLPFIAMTALTVEGNELICANLGIDEFGVSAEIVNTVPAHIN
jgi:hypothetical protein